MPPLVVTRPQPEADQWVVQLHASGIDSVALPLLHIGPSTHPRARAALQQALQQLAHYQALMFVSGNAVRFFFAQLHAHGLQLSPQQRLWAPGPGTSQALRAAGVPAQCIDEPDAGAAQFDSEALWQVVGTQLCAGQRLLLVRGSDTDPASAAIGQGRTWLTEQLQARGVQVDFAPVYERHPPIASAPWLQQLDALRAQQALWLFSSSDAVRHLQALSAPRNWQAHTALATHPRIAQQALQAGFGRVLDCKPALQAIALSIKSLA